MAPEQATGLALTESSHAFGLMLFEALTGQKYRHASRGWSRSAEPFGVRPLDGARSGSSLSGTSAPRPWSATEEHRDSEWAQGTYGRGCFRGTLFGVFRTGWPGARGKPHPISTRCQTRGLCLSPTSTLRTFSGLRVG